MFTAIERIPHQRRALQISIPNWTEQPRFQRLVAFVGLKRNAHLPGKAKGKEANVKHIAQMLNISGFTNY
jgi:hypothetical protein